MSALWTIAALVVGWALKGLSDEWQERRSRAREAAAGREQRAARAELHGVEFQRESLLGLQEAVARLARTVAAAHRLEAGSFRSGGQKSPLPEAMRDAIFEGRLTVIKLAARIGDEATRALAKEFGDQLEDVLPTGPGVASDEDIRRFGFIIESLNERVGQVLRDLALPHTTPAEARAEPKPLPRITRG